jgi:PAS domain-containing protein
MRKLDRLYSILKVVKKIHRLIFESKDVDSLIAGICRCFTELQYYYYAWIVLLDDEGRLVSSCDLGRENYFCHIQEKLRAGKIPPSLKKALDGENFVQIEKSLHPHRKAIMTSLSYEDRSFGVLGVVIDKVLADDEEELGLVKDIAEETSFALHNLIREEELEKSREWLITTINSIGDAVIATDISSKLVLMNGVAESLTGYSAEEVYGRDINDFFHIKNEKTGEKPKMSCDFNRCFSTRYKTGLPRLI